MRYYELKESQAVEHYAPMAKEHGLDASDNIAVRKMIETADKIRNDCQFYLSQIKGADTGFPRDQKQSIAWRGMSKEKHGDTQFVLKDVRLDGRNPKDTDVDSHNYINREFTKLYGEPFRNAMFMTGNMRDTLRYGHAFQVFPVGQFNFIWSPTVTDLWIKGGELRRALRIPMSRFTDPEERMKNEQYKSKVFKEFNENVISSYQTDDMKAALGSGKEIMVRCKSYYAVDFDNITKNVLDENKTYPESHKNKIREAVETVFYKIVNNK